MNSPCHPSLRDFLASWDKNPLPLEVYSTEECRCPAEQVQDRSKWLSRNSACSCLDALQAFQRALLLLPVALERAAEAVMPRVHVPE